jgi:hypothetical protein
MDPVSMARAGVPLPMGMDIAKSFSGIQNDMQGLSDKQRAEFSERIALANQPLQALLDPNITPQAAQAALDQHNSLMDRAISDNPRLGQRFPRLPEQFSSDPATFQQQKQTFVAQTGLSAQAAELASKAATQRETTAKAAQQELLTGQMQKAIQGDQQSNSTANGEAAIHSAFNPPGAKESIDPTTENAFVQQYRTAPRVPSAEDPTGVKAGQAVLTAAVAHAGQIGMKTSPTVQAAEASQAAQTQAALMPGKVQEAAALEKAKLSFMEQAAAFSHGLEQHGVAAKTLQDGMADYLATTAQWKQLGQAVQMARGGNEVAASQIPGLASAFQVAMYDMRRMPAEMNKSFGSLQDHMANAYDSVIHNRPVNWGELNQLPAYLDSVVGAAANRYNGIAQSVEQNYSGVKASRVTPPSPPPQGGAARANGGHQVGDSVMWRGQIRTISGFDGKGNAILK